MANRTVILRQPSKWVYGTKATVKITNNNGSYVTPIISFYSGSTQVGSMKASDILPKKSLKWTYTFDKSLINKYVKTGKSNTFRMHVDLTQTEGKVNVVVGSQDATITVYAHAGDIRPTMEALTVSDSDSIASKAGYYVSGKSKLVLAGGATSLRAGATQKSLTYQWKNSAGNVIATSTNFGITSSADVASVTKTLTDSRGLVVSQTAKVAKRSFQYAPSAPHLTLVDYAADGPSYNPTTGRPLKMKAIINFALDKSSDALFDSSARGDFISIKYVNTASGSNPVTIANYGANNANNALGSNVTTDAGTTVVTNKANNYTISQIDGDPSYQITATIKTVYGALSASVTASNIYATIDFSPLGTGVAIGKQAAEGSFDVALDTRLDGELQLSKPVKVLLKNEAVPGDGGTRLKELITFGDSTNRSIDQQWAMFGGIGGDTAIVAGDQARDYFSNSSHTGETMQIASDGGILFYSGADGSTTTTLKGVTSSISESGDFQSGRDLRTSPGGKLFAFNIGPASGDKVQFQGGAHIDTNGDIISGRDLKTREGHRVYTNTVMPLSGSRLAVNDFDFVRRKGKSHWLRLNGPGGDLSLRNDANGPGDWTSMASATASKWNTSSTKDIKTNIQDVFNLEQKLDSLLSLHPRQYVLNQNIEVALSSINGENHDESLVKGALNPEFGLIVEELQEVGLDEFLSYDSDTGKARAIDYGRIVTLLIPAIQRERERTSELELRLLKLEKKVNNNGTNDSY